MKKKLVWKDETERPILKSTITGHFAMWAVRQSPYLFPHDLQDGIDEFSAALGDGDGFLDATCAGLEKIVRDIIALCRTVSYWNLPKKGKPKSYVFVTRTDKPDPDHDIIDLSALARNVAHSVWLEILYDDGGFEDGAWEKMQTSEVGPAPGIPGAIDDLGQVVEDGH